MSENCPICDDTGWRPVMIGGDRRMTRCECLTRQRAAEEKGHPGGFTAAGFVARQMVGALPKSPTRLADILAARPELEAALTGADALVGKLVETHVGKARAISIRELLPLLGEGWTDRSVKRAIQHLRDVAGLPIVASKEPPYGLFIPETAEEVDEAYERYVGEGIALFRIARLVKPTADLARELHGQGILEEVTR